ncbi:hypothetical protein [Nocardia lasii]|uniref:Uncharacterized protein n=1 Tax=Nocardia lasii TaxID=1616107 RepID=A0ABW1JXA6_9NOCA
MRTRLLTITAGTLAAAALSFGNATAAPAAPGPAPVADSGSAALSFLDGILHVIRCGSSATCGNFPFPSDPTTTAIAATPAGW